MDLRETALRFVAEAFGQLRAEFVIPTPIYHPYVHVGHDYFGDSVRHVAPFGELERLLEHSYPHRFDPPPSRPHPEFANTYIFSLLEACVARCGRKARLDRLDHFDPTSDAVTESIEEMISALDSETYEVVCCRFVSHLTTEQAAEIVIGGITIVPENASRPELLVRIAEEIPGAAGAFQRDQPRPWDPPHGLLIARERTNDSDPYEVGQKLSRELDRFLRITRVFSASTARTLFQVTGTTTLVSRMRPFMAQPHGGGSWVRRTVWLSDRQAPAFVAIAALVESARIKRDGMAATSFDVALAKFNNALRQENAFEQIVDLATALEAILAGGETETEALTLRLRTRAAALLATEGDPATAVFKDVGLLYALRSKLVHGGQIKVTALRKDLGRLSTMPAGEVDAKLGIAMGHAVDRMRDLVRRAILARLCLAAEPDPLWPFVGDIAVDAELADDAMRRRWRAGWHTKLAQLGIGEAARPAPNAVAIFTPLDTEQRRQLTPTAQAPADPEL